MGRFEDLHAILPEQFKEVANRKINLVLGGVILILIICCLSLAILVLVHHGDSSSTDMTPQAAAQTLRKHFCLSPGCLRTASHVLDYMDFKTPPCADFHKYSCGNWARAMGLPPDHDEQTTWSHMQDVNDERMREIIDSPIRHDTPDSAERKLKDFFRSCLHDYGHMKEAGKSLAKIIREKLGGWYSFDPEGFPSNSWDFNNALKEMTAELLVPVLFKVRVVYDWQGTRKSRYMKNMPGITTGGTGLGLWMYRKNDRRGVQEAYKDMMREMGDLLLTDANITMDPTDREQRLEQFVQDAFGVEYKLASLYRQSRRLRGYWRSARITIGELSTNMTQIKWRQLLNSYFEHADMTSRTTVRMSYFKYFGVMEQWLMNVTANQTEFDRKMNNYFVWRLLDDYAPNLSWQYKFAGYRFYETVSGVREFPPDWKRCLTLTKNRLGTIVSGEYVKKHVDDKDVKKLKDIVKYTKETLYDVIDDIKWMDNVTVARAKEKLDSVESHVAFSNDYLSETFLDDLHAKVDVRGDYSFFQNLINVNAYQKVINAKVLQADETYFAWWSYMAGVAYVFPHLYWRSNQLIVPIGTFQRPIYDSKAPAFYNFGSMGGFLGELMVKSIGEMGRYVWTNGTWTNWWTKNTTAMYKEEKDCMISHFNNITLSFMINGQNKTAPVYGWWQAWVAIDDMAGFKAGYKAYKRYVADNGAEAVPAGMNMTSDEAYFVAVSQMRCFIRRPEKQYQNARRWRIPEDVLLNSALTHSQVFQDTFNCKKEDGMGVHDTCEVY